MSAQLQDEVALRAIVADQGAKLEGAHPFDVLDWAGETFGPGLVVASSMGDEVLVHLAGRAVPGVDVIFLDTGYHFAETIGTRDAYAETTDITLRTILPLRTVAEQDAEHGPRLHDRDPNLCCALRKVEPLERGLAPYRAWVTGMRREDAPTRTDIAVVGWDDKRGKVKLNPLAAWTQDDVDAYVAQHGVLLNPLRQLGYTSIGCAPCTRAVAPGEDPRAGRWAGLDKTECGLHT
ncbi:phosphoadenylyl-sulfate reductase (plasmid) [Cellulomonas sp. WB94]|uniref:phosphoadenylyl-sulfate reductase n=1 Tax=Cellulomonas sp. WB94 TaxID=2173174 RepID=UPI000D581660|nr:phosphoadenylyl-sulfate reductase [Cellulomonas sp. WB94]PVU81763.1 phosphoadenylyl-sulfate reductase [Cellulomonas sp. WB94]